MPDRRTQIAEAGVRLVASRGVRALTHRAIDSELGLPSGSTSYYARSRRDLLGLIVVHLADRTRGEILSSRLPATVTSAAVADLLVEDLAKLRQRPDEHRARLLLWLELHGDPELQSVLATKPEDHRAFVLTATSVLELLEVADPQLHARNLVGLLDALALERVARTAVINEREVLTAYLEGLPRLESEANRAALNPAAAARGLFSRIRGPR